MTQVRYNILYNGRKIYQDLSMDDCAEVIQDLSESYFSGENIDPNLIELEEIKNG